jgi:hypothetical protein
MFKKFYHSNNYCWSGRGIFILQERHGLDNMFNEKKVENNEKVKSQSVTFLLTYIFIQSFDAIIGFIALCFFRPIWNKIIKWFYGKS